MHPRLLRSSAVALTLLFSLAVPALAQNTNLQSGDSFDQTVQLRQPEPRIGIPGLEFTPIERDPEQGVIYVSYLGQYIAAVYKYAVAVASIVAVVMIIVAGFQWTASGGSPDAIGAAKKRIVGAVTGLILAVGSYTLLYAINPELVQFRNLRVQYVEKKDLNEYLAESGELEASQEWDWTAESFNCDNKPALPVSFPKKEALVTRTCPVGVLGSFTVVPQMADLICRVGEILNTKGYGIQITDSFRTYEKQVELWCERGKQEYPDPQQRKRFFAVPGYSPHSLGVSIDAHLTKNNQRLYTGMTGRSQCGLFQNEQTKEYPKILADAFYEAGLFRLTSEIWHFEYVAQPQTNFPARLIPKDQITATNMIKPSSCTP